MALIYEGKTVHNGTDEGTVWKNVKLRISPSHLTGTGVSIWRHIEIPFIIIGKRNSNNDTYSVFKLHLHQIHHNYIQYTLKISNNLIEILGNFSHGKLHLI